MFMHSVHCFSKTTSLKRLGIFFMGSLLLLLAGCASTLKSDVTSFQQWPANTANSSYSFKRTGAQVGALEHASYEDLVRSEMSKLALKEAPAGTKGRFEISLEYAATVKTQRVIEPIYDYSPTWRDPYFMSSWGWRPGYGSPYGYGHAFGTFGTFGPRIIGYETLNRDTSTRRLRIDIAEGANKVFEATAINATNNGSNPALSSVMPYLIRSVFDGFPGANGQARRVEFDVDKNTIKTRQVAQPR
jgi:Domain of unknown function (DUF4136)